MSASILTFLGVVLTVVVGPLIAFAIKRWWDKIQTDAATKERQRLEDVAAGQGNADLSNKLAKDNDAIAKEDEARQKFEDQK